MIEKSKIAFTLPIAIPETPALHEYAGQMLINALQPRENWIAQLEAQKENLAIQHQEIQEQARQLTSLRQRWLFERHRAHINAWWAICGWFIAICATVALFLK